MKTYKSLTTRIFVIAVLLFAGIMSGFAQARFIIQPVEAEGDVTEEVAGVIFRKTEQILTRNSAAAADQDSIYAVRAQLSVTGEAQSSGLVRNVTSISGELILTAVNTEDGTKYHTVTVPLHAVLKGTAADDAVMALAKTIKPSDAVYTRFVRVARERIASMNQKHEEEKTGSPAD